MIGVQAQPRAEPINMHTKTKTHAEPRETIINRVRPLMLHAVEIQAPSNVVDARRRIVATHASSEANHERHHVSRQSQS
jgi:hypothetical protein